MARTVSWPTPSPRYPWTGTSATSPPGLACAQAVRRGAAMAAQSKTTPMTAHPTLPRLRHSQVSSAGPPVSEMRRPVW